MLAKLRTKHPLGDRNSQIQLDTCKCPFPSVCPTPTHTHQLIADTVHVTHPTQHSVLISSHTFTSTCNRPC